VCVWGGGGHGLYVMMVLFEVWVGGVGWVLRGVEGSRAPDWVEGAEALRAGGAAATVRVAVPCSTSLVVAFTFVSAVVGVLLVVPVAVSARSVVAGSEAKAVWSVVAGVSRSPKPPCTQ
jgi:hypothetical protein